MARMLVVSSEMKDFQIVQAAVIGESHFVSHTTSGLQGVKLAQETLPDIIFISNRAEDLDGLSLCEYLRYNLQLPSLLVMVQDENSSESRVASYKAGADDIVTKPMHLTEMHHHLKALMRRIPHAELEQDRISVGCLTLDRTACSVYVKNRAIQLTPSEFNLLNHLMSNPGRIFSSEELLRDVWNYHPGTGDPAIVRMQVMKLRNKIEQNPSEPSFLQTVYRHGYRFVGDIG
ncbi:response regulator [bacterium]|jgi:DNA-binding response OmpR family regulator|nr:response regulator [bacterium]